VKNRSFADPVSGARAAAAAHPVAPRRRLGAKQRRHPPIAWPTLFLTFHSELVSGVLPSFAPVQNFSYASSHRVCTIAASPGKQTAACCRKKKGQVKWKSYGSACCCARSHVSCTPHSNHCRPSARSSNNSIRHSCSCRCKKSAAPVRTAEVIKRTTWTGCWEFSVCVRRVERRPLPPQLTWRRTAALIRAHVPKMVTCLTI
jgi:hypothetical protein